MTWTTSFSLPREIALEKNALLTDLPVLAKEWRVSFEIKPTSYNYNGYAQVLQMTTGGKKGKIGDRTPALWIHKTKGVYIATTLNGKPNEGHFFKTKKPSLNEWTSVEISQVVVGSKYIFSLIIGGETLWSVENTKPRKFYSVKVFASSGWYAAQEGSIRQFKIENILSGETYYPFQLSRTAL